MAERVSLMAADPDNTLATVLANPMPTFAKPANTTVPTLSFRWSDEVAMAVAHSRGSSSAIFVRRGRHAAPSAFSYAPVGCRA